MTAAPRPTCRRTCRHSFSYGGLNLGEGDLKVELEAPVGGGRRIDVETGFTVIETKRDLRHGNVRVEAEKQLAGYVRDRARQLGQRYVGVLTDGADWRLYHLGADEALHEVSRFELSPTAPDAEGLTVWLEGALATAEEIQPTPKEIERRLGARSSSHALDYAELTSLYAAHADGPTVRLKRELGPKGGPINGRRFECTLQFDQSQAYRRSVPDSSAAIISKLFEQAAGEASMSLVAETLEALWRDNNWTALAIASQLERVEESLLQEHGS